MDHSTLPSYNYLRSHDRGGEILGVVVVLLSFFLVFLRGDAGEENLENSHAIKLDSPSLGIFFESIADREFEMVVALGATAADMMGYRYTV